MRGIESIHGGGGSGRSDGGSKKNIKSGAFPPRLGLGGRVVLRLRYSPGVWIHLLRHGIAIDRDDPACPADPLRELTEKGRARTVEVADAFAGLHPVIDAIAVSPYRRAEQTADIFVDALGLETVLRWECEALMPMEDPDRALDALRARPAQGILVVGHAPSLDRLGSRLCGAPQPIFKLKKAGIAMMTADILAVGRGTLVALFPPRALRRLGRARVE